MINGAHVVVHSRDAEADRAFLAETLGFPHVDAGGGWLIFALPPAEVAVHPADGSADQRHELYLMCDDIDATVAELATKGVDTAGPITEAGWGRVATLRLPGGGELSIYEPRHTRATGG